LITQLTAITNFSSVINHEHYFQSFSRPMICIVHTSNLSELLIFKGPCFAYRHKWSLANSAAQHLH